MCVPTCFSLEAQKEIRPQQPANGFPQLKSKGMNGLQIQFSSLDFSLTISTLVYAIVRGSRT
jgi:hypothetical protein